MSKKKLLLSTPRFDVFKEQYETSGQKKDFYYISKPDAVAILVQLKNKIGLVEIKRELISGTYFELIGGRIEKNEEPIDAARRELFEEVGLKSKNWILIKEVFPLPSLTTEKVHIFLVNIEEFDFNTENIQTEEGLINFSFYSKNKILQMIKNSKITNTLDAFALYYFFENYNYRNIKTINFKNS